MGSKKFKPGQSGNPDGRPKGSRNKTTLAVEELLDGEAEALTRKAIEKAKGGDTVALRLCLDRICPARRDRHIEFELPKMEAAKDAATAAAAIVGAVARGEITPNEAGELGRLVEAFAKTLQVSDHEARLEALERQSGMARS